MRRSRSWPATRRCAARRSGGSRSTSIDGTATSWPPWGRDVREDPPGCGHRRAWGACGMRWRSGSSATGASPLAGSPPAPWIGAERHALTAEPPKTERGHVDSDEHRADPTPNVLLDDNIVIAGRRCFQRGTSCKLQAVAVGEERVVEAWDVLVVSAHLFHRPWRSKGRRPSGGSSLTIASTSASLLVPKLATSAAARGAAASGRPGGQGPPPPRAGSAGRPG
jgi:hypothetical protein